MHNMASVYATFWAMTFHIMKFLNPAKEEKPRSFTKNMVFAKQELRGRYWMMEQSFLEHLAYIPGEEVFI
jgi:hypothetical protein